MALFFVLLAAALIASACGFHRYLWFISVGYGLAIALIGAVMMVIFRASPAAIPFIQNCIFIVYGLRLAGYLLHRELKVGGYGKRVMKDAKTSSDVSFGVKIAIWITVAFLYAFQTCPVLFRLENGTSGLSSDILGVLGIVISAAGVVIESAADVQKSRSKKKRPGRFVDTGLYRIVRCPNYMGELMLWTGVFISGLTVYNGPGQWISAIAGYAGIVYVMFSGARRLEIRQDRDYGHMEEYVAYKDKTPIMIPFVPLYSVKKHKWLVA